MNTTEKVRQKRNYKERCIIGKFGENIVAEYFSQNKQKYQFLDVSLIKEYQEQGIDFLLTINHKGKHIFTTLDVKAVEETLYKYNSVCIKINTEYKDKTECQKRGNDAYIAKSRAEYLFYVCCQTKDIFVVKTKNLRAYICQNIDSLKTITYRDVDATLQHDRYNRKNVSVYVKLEDVPGVKKIKTNSKLEFIL